LKPKIDSLLTGYQLRWLEVGVTIKATGIKERKESITGEITVSTSLPGFFPHLLTCGFNFSSLPARDKLIKSLTNSCTELPWNSIIEQLRVHVIRAYRQGEPARLLTQPENGSPAHQWLIKPFLYQNAMNVMFGDGGTGKSTLALYLAGLLSVEEEDLPYTNTCFTVHASGRVLYLDYESEWESMAAVYSKMYESENVFHRRCNMPLHTDIEQIAAIIDAERINTLFIDSLGLACGADLNDAATAIQFASSLRKLKCTSLVIAHNSKYGTDKSIYGSVYFHNNARNVWEIKKVQEISEDEYKIGLFHRKCNLGKLQHPMILRVMHANDILTYTEDDMEGFEESLSISTRIKQCLKTPKTVKEMSVTLGNSEGSLRKVLQRLKTKGVTDKNERNQWFLIDNEHERDSHT
jgi:energy-coupling factor transporter ATP-binding protein EcfA2